MTHHAPKLEDLLGLPWWCLGRTADMQWFHFGARRTIPSLRGSPREVGDYALHVQSPWRVCLDGKIVLGSQDLSFPAGTSRLDEVPEDFDWKRYPTRLDEVAAALIRHFLPRNVTNVQFGRCGSLALTFEGSLSLEVFPDASVESESWRLFVPGDHEREHLVDESTMHVVVIPGVAASLDPARRRRTR